jgi:hypothetical protein
VDIGGRLIAYRRFAANRTLDQTLERRAHECRCWKSHGYQARDRPAGAGFALWAGTGARAPKVHGSSSRWGATAAGNKRRGQGLEAMEKLLNVHQERLALWNAPSDAAALLVGVIIALAIGSHFGLIESSSFIYFFSGCLALLVLLPWPGHLPASARWLERPAVRNSEI